MTLISFLSSVRLTIVLISLLAIVVLLGAWCPQIPQSGQTKVVEQFGFQTADVLIKTGIADIFHSAFFLFLIGMLTLNIIFGSFKHVFPKLKLLKLPMPWLSTDQINKLPLHHQFVTNKPIVQCKQELITWLNKRGYKVSTKDNSITAQFGKYGRLAPTITHIGLLTLLSGVILSSLTGFSGFKVITPGTTFSFADSQHSHPWLGKLPTWQIKVNSSRREDYTNGEAKQWYSNLTVIDPYGKELKSQTISVNDPLSYDGVDIYQSSWALKSLKIKFNDLPKELDLQPMGKLYAAFLPLPDQAVMIFSVRDQRSPLRIFAKRQDWSAPKLITQVPLNKESKLGSVSIHYDGSVPQTGLQYKCDPGLPIIYAAFALLIIGISLAAVPYRQIWATLMNNISNQQGTLINIGGTTKKGKQSLTKQINTLVIDMQKEDN